MCLLYEKRRGDTNTNVYIDIHYSVGTGN